jgi:signal transduction histidine kinase/CheY-like chemotaxis protein
LITHNCRCANIENFAYTWAYKIKMKHLLIAIFHILFCLTSFGQTEHQAQPDDEIKLGSEVVSELLKWADELQFDDSDKALVYLNRAKQIADNRKDRVLQADVSQAMSIFHWSRGNFENALECDRKTLSLYQSLNDNSGLAYAFNSLAVTLSDMGYSNEAIKNYIEAELLMTQLNDSSGLQMVYVNMGVALDNLRDYEGALRLYHKSLDIGMALDLYDELGDVFNNMAEAYVALKKYDLAYGYYLKAQDIYQNTGQIEGMAMIQGNLADYFRLSGNDLLAEELYLKAIEEYKRIKGNHGLCMNLVGLGKVYRNQGEYKNAMSILKEAMELAKANNYVPEIIEAQRAISQVYYFTKNYTKAYESFLEYDQMKDSLYNSTRIVEFDRLRKSFEADKNQRDLEALQLQMEKDLIISTQKDRWGYALIVITVMLLGFLITVVLLYQRLRNTNILLEKRGGDLVIKNKEIEKQTRQLQVANAKLLSEKKLAEISSEAKAEFVSVLSHEIRTPLNAIIGLTHLLKSDLNEDERQKHIESLSYSAENLIGFTTNILELSRLDAGRIEIQQESFHLSELLKRIRTTFVPALKEKSLSLEMNCEPDIPEFITGDRVRLTQILLNLISNAIKYTNTGGVRVEVEKCSETDDTVSLCFMVIDTGMGIEMDLQNKIFDRYSRLQKESTLTPQGTGLGLSIAKSLIELMDGSIEFSSKPEQGSTFKVKIPFCKPTTETSGTVSKATKEITNITSLDGTHILLVEDNPVNVLFTRKILSSWGVKVEVAENGLIAIDKALNQDFDLILMDLQMPEMNGIDASQRIAKFAPDVPIIALTANADGDTSKLLEHAPMCDLLEKPFRPDELKHKIQQWINRVE